MAGRVSAAGADHPLRRGRASCAEQQQAQGIVEGLVPAGDERAEEGLLGGGQFGLPGGGLRERQPDERGEGAVVGELVRRGGQASTAGRTASRSLAPAASASARSQCSQLSCPGRWPVNQRSASWGASRAATSSRVARLSDQYGPAQQLHR